MSWKKAFPFLIWRASNVKLAKLIRSSQKLPVKVICFPLLYSKGMKHYQTTEKELILFQVMNKTSCLVLGALMLWAALKFHDLKLEWIFIIYIVTPNPRNCCWEWSEFWLILHLWFFGVFLYWKGDSYTQCHLFINWLINVTDLLVKLYLMLSDKYKFINYNKS